VAWLAWIGETAKLLESEKQEFHTLFARQNTMAVIFWSKSSFHHDAVDTPIPHRF
jgi:hypothetical protein